MSEIKIKMELVWIQNLKALITHGLFRTDERWKKIFIDKLDHIGALERENSQLREAANAVIAQWDTPNWKLEQPTAVLIENLRTALRDAGGGE